MAGGITPVCQIGVYRVLTGEFLEYRRNAVFDRHASDSEGEDVRWVSQRGWDYCRWYGYGERRESEISGDQREFERKFTSQGVVTCQ